MTGLLITTQVGPLSKIDPRRCNQLQNRLFAGIPIGADRDPGSNEIPFATSNAYRAVAGGSASALFHTYTTTGDTIRATGSWRLIKTFFVRGLPITERLSRVRRGGGECDIWQHRFWEHTIRDDGNYAMHMDYVHFNPFKHGLVASPADWPYSTFSSCAERGLYPLDWIGNGIGEIEAGEPGG